MANRSLYSPFGQVLPTHRLPGYQSGNYFGPWLCAVCPHWSPRSEFMVFFGSLHLVRWAIYACSVQQQGLRVTTSRGKFEKRCTRRGHFKVRAGGSRRIPPQFLWNPKGGVQHVSVFLLFALRLCKIQVPRILKVGERALIMLSVHTENHSRAHLFPPVAHKTLAPFFVLIGCWQSPSLITDSYCASWKPILS